MEYERRSQPQGLRCRVTPHNPQDIADRLKRVGSSRPRGGVTVAKKIFINYRRADTEGRPAASTTRLPGTPAGGTCSGTGMIWVPVRILSTASPCRLRTSTFSSP